MYQSAHEENKAGTTAKAQSQLTPKQLAQCCAGIARTTLRLGDIRHGRALALESGGDDRDDDEVSELLVANRLLLTKVETVLNLLRLLCQ